MYEKLSDLSQRLPREGFIADARQLQAAIAAIDAVLEVLHNMKDDGFKITNEEIADIRNEWSGNK